MCYIHAGIGIGISMYVHIYVFMRFLNDKLQENLLRYLITDGV